VLNYIRAASADADRGAGTPAATGGRAATTTPFASARDPAQVIHQLQQEVVCQMLHMLLLVSIQQLSCFTVAQLERMKNAGKNDFQRLRGVSADGAAKSSSMAVSSPASRTNRTTRITNNLESVDRN